MDCAFIKHCKLVPTKKVIHPFQVIRRFDFGQSQTASSLTKFVEKINNILNSTQIYYENIFYLFNETNLVL